VSNDERQCAVGRTIARGDRLGGLDWMALCPTPAGRHSIILTDRTRGGTSGPIDLCDRHAEVLLPALEAARQERLSREQ